MIITQDAVAIIITTTHGREVRDAEEVHGVEVSLEGCVERALSARDSHGHCAENACVNQNHECKGKGDERVNKNQKDTLWEGGKETTRTQRSTE